MLCVGALAVVLGLLPNATVLATGMFVGAVPQALDQGLSSPPGHRAVLALALVSLGFALSGAGMALARFATEVLTTRLVHTVAETTGRACLRPRDIGVLETPDVVRDLAVLADVERSGLLLQVASAVRMNISRRIAGAGAAVILCAFAWWAPIALVAGWLVANVVSSRWLDRGFAVARTEGGGRLRRAEYVRSLAVDRSAAKELRIFGLADWVGRGYAQTWLEAMTSVWRTRRATARELAGGIAVIAVAYAAVFGALGWQASEGTVGIGALTVFGLAALATEDLGFLGDPQWRIGRAATMARQLLLLEGRLEERLAEADAPDRSARPAATRRAPRTGAPAEVRLEDVGFAYGTGRPVLAGLDLHIPPGQSVAVVGDNGAGKSTLIKLVCGLYPASSGRVRLDGVDLRTVGTDELRGRIGVIFQDFVRYELPLRENVGFGSLSSGSLSSGSRSRPDGQAAVEAALRDAGAGAMPATMPHGWDTVLARGFDGGVDLSGGQWQKIALARALAAVRGGAGLLILDEPTANLDVRAETELFDRFLDLTRDVTTILVSHRLSSVRHADRIVVLAEGRLVEDGTHAQLLAAGGRYARMFRLQAERFHEETSAEAATTTTAATLDAASTTGSAHA